MTLAVVRGDAARLPLPDASVDLIVTSPPYFALRSYTDGGTHYAGQIGSEATPAAYIAALIDCTREWVRVLKPSGSIFVNLGDSYYSGKGAPGRTTVDEKSQARTVRRAGGNPLDGPSFGIARKSLCLLPERYRIACVDQLGLIARAVIVWAKPNGLHESVTDRVRRSHEDWVHLTKAPRYYAAVDEIREPHARSWGPGNGGTRSGPHALGALPGSVWTVATEPLKVPERLGVDHFAAFPSEWPRRLILGWSPPGICTACGEGRRPVVMQQRETFYGAGRFRSGAQQVKDGAAVVGWKQDEKWRTQTTITGYVCACTPYTDHPGTGEPTGAHGLPGTDGRAVDRYPQFGQGTAHDNLNARPKVGPWREYHFDRWTPPPTRPAVVLDPFGGTGTTAHVAAALGRTGITVDLSSDYSRLAAAPELRDARRRKVLGLDKPTVAVVGEGQLGFEWDGASA